MSNLLTFSQINTDYSRMGRPRAVVDSVWADGKETLRIWRISVEWKFRFYFTVFPVILTSIRDLLNSNIKRKYAHQNFQIILDTLEFLGQIFFNSINLLREHVQSWRDFASGEVVIFKQTSTPHQSGCWIQLLGLYKLQSITICSYFTSSSHLLYTMCKLYEPTPFSEKLLQHRRRGPPAIDLLVRCYFNFLTRIQELAKFVKGVAKQKI